MYNIINVEGNFFNTISNTKSRNIKLCNVVCKDNVELYYSSHSDMVFEIINTKELNVINVYNIKKDVCRDLALLKGVTLEEVKNVIKKYFTDTFVIDKVYQQNNCRLYTTLNHSECIVTCNNKIGLFKSLKHYYYDGVLYNSVMTLLSQFDIQYTKFYYLYNKYKNMMTFEEIVDYVVKGIINEKISNQPSKSIIHGKSVVYKGTTYPSIDIALKDIGLTLRQYYYTKRIVFKNDFENFEQIVDYVLSHETRNKRRRILTEYENKPIINRTNSKEVHYNNKTYSSINNALKELGFSRSQFNHAQRIVFRNTNQDASEIINYLVAMRNNQFVEVNTSGDKHNRNMAVAVNYKGKHYTSIKQALEDLGIPMRKFFYVQREIFKHKNTTVNQIFDYILQ